MRALGRSFLPIKRNASTISLGLISKICSARRKACAATVVSLIRVSVVRRSRSVSMTMRESRGTTSLTSATAYPPVHWRIIDACRGAAGSREARDNATADGV